jgi:hypothetical protein
MQIKKQQGLKLRMTKINYAILMGLISLIGCQQTQEANELKKEKSAEAQTSKIYENRSSDEADSSELKQDSIEIILVNQDSISSSAENEDCNMIMSPGMFYKVKNKETDAEWAHVEVIQMFGFNKPIPIGELVQVIPPHSDLPVQLLKVLNCVQQEGIEADWYELELETINSPAFKNHNAPEGFRGEYLGFGVGIYPPIAGASVIASDSTHLQQEQNIKNKRLEIDFNNDGVADAFLTKVCQKEFIDESGKAYCDQSGYTIEYKCNNRWVLMYESKGC